MTVYDPWTNPAIAKHEYVINIVTELPDKKYDACIAAVAHRLLEGMDVLGLINEKYVIFDVKCTLDRSIMMQDYNK